MLHIHGLAGTLLDVLVPGPALMLRYLTLLVLLSCTLVVTRSHPSSYVYSYHRFLFLANDTKPTRTTPQATWSFLQKTNGRKGFRIERRPTQRSVS